MTMTSPDFTKRRRALAWAATQSWAIERRALEHLLQIAAREHDPDFDAVLARQGERLRAAADVQVRDSVAILEIVGPIFPYANLFTRISGATSIDQAALDLHAALADPRVRAIVLNIDSPGGATKGISDFAKMVRGASKHVVAFVSGSAASAAYWIAAAAAEVVVSDTAIVGSIGIVAQIRLDEDDKLLEIVSSQSPDKRPNLRTDAGRAVVQRTVDELAQVFIEAVAGYRRVSTDKVTQDFGRGGVLVGRNAVTAGMGDSIGTLESVLESFANGGHGPAWAGLARQTAAERSTRETAVGAGPNVVALRRLR
ncbi:MAG: S49 family peptidase [Gammaproteobacteria bacterium]